MKKQDYCPPQITVLELGYAEPVCQATSGSVPDYDPITNPGFNTTGLS